MYSLRALVLDKLCPTLNLQIDLCNHLSDMARLDERMNKIWRKHGKRGWRLIGHSMKKIWNIRSLMVSKYLERNPGCDFFDILVPLILDGTNAGNCVYRVHMAMQRNMRHKYNGSISCRHSNDSKSITNGSMNRRC